MSTAAHPETDGQTERVNRVLEDVLRSYATSFVSWAEFLPLAEFAINNAVHASTGLTPFFVNSARHPRVPAVLALGSTTSAPGSTLGGRYSNSNSIASLEAPAPQPVHTSLSLSPYTLAPSTSIRDISDVTSGVTPPATTSINGVSSDVTSGVTSLLANYEPKEPTTAISSAAVSEFMLQRQAVTRFVRDALQAAVDKQKENADHRGRKNKHVFRQGDRVLLSTTGIAASAVTNNGTLKLAP